MNPIESETPNPPPEPDNKQQTAVVMPSTPLPEPTPAPAPQPTTPSITPPTVPPAYAPTPAPATPEPHRRSSFKKIVLTLIFVMLLAAVAYGVYAVWQPDKTTPGVTTKKLDVPLLNVGVAGGKIGLYPASGTDSYEESINSQMFEGLVQYQDETKLVPALATGWHNPNSDTWVFDLKHNVQFHDGNSMTAADVIYSMNLATQDADLADGYASTIKDAKALSTYQVQITTKQPDPFFLNRLTFLKILDAKQPKATDGSNGTGPYKLKPGTTISDTKISLVAFDAYHGGHVYTRALSFNTEPDEDSLSKAVKAGKIQFAGEYSSTKLSLLSSVPHQTVSVNDPAVTFMALNSIASGPLQKQAVRQALRDSIDIPKLIKDVDIYAQPSAQLMTEAIPGFNQSLTVPKQDVTKAKSLLASAGYPQGVSLTLTTSTPNKKIADEIAAQAKAAGFTITVKTEADFDTFIDEMLAGKTEISVISYSSDVLDGSDVFTQVIQNGGDYKSATLDGYLDQAAATIDQAQRLQILQKTSKYLNDDVAAIPLFNRQRVWVADPSYHLQFDTQTATPGVYFWQVYKTE